MSNNQKTVSRVLTNLHNGDSISDADLLYSIRILNTILDIFQGVDAPSMPEYAVFVKALSKDVDQLEDFDFCRRKH